MQKCTLVSIRFVVSCLLGVASLFGVGTILRTQALTSATVGTDAATSSPLASEGCACQFFGASVAVSGSTIAVGQPGANSGAGQVNVYYRATTTRNWVPEASLVATSASSQAQFGRSVALYGTTAIVGAPLQDGVGAAYVFSDASGTWTQVAELTAGTAGAEFGYSVSIYGPNAIVGAPGSNQPHTSSTEGFSVIYERIDGRWVSRATLTPPSSRAGDDFGNAVAIANGTAVVDQWNSNTGTAFIYKGNGNLWAVSAQLTVIDAQGKSDLGSSVAISGKTVAIGATLAYGSKGAVYVYSDASGAWTTIAQLAPKSPGVGQFFSNKSIALAGHFLVVGAPSFGGSPGSAYVFTYWNGEWKQQQHFLAQPSPTEQSIGAATAISGSTELVGAPTAYGYGRVYAETYDPSHFEPALLLTPDSGTAGDEFGSSVAISGTTAVVGAPGFDGKGTAYVFSEIGSVPLTAGTIRCTPGTIGSVLVAGECRAWTQVGQLSAANLVSGDEFGSSVAISGTTAVVGAPGFDGKGTAYVFSDASGAWTQVGQLSAANLVSGDEFGSSVAISGTTAVVGAPGLNSNQVSDHGHGVSYGYTVS
ncbi:MAG: FG-GAP repeat protein [Ferrimicrobium sp.]|jgi:hypothetical protein|nr:FG-GAP repeat protein [Ferrimicrobium sp.]